MASRITWGGGNKRTDSGESVGHGQLRFGSFQLSSRHGPLLQDGVEIKLQPKALALLWALVRQPGEVIPRSSLMDSVWPGAVVGEQALTFQIQNLRRALGDDAQTPKIIVTAHRVGFRFALPVQDAAQASATAEASPFVGRQSELRHLEKSLASAVQGKRQLVFVTGEAGMGKSALLDRYIEGIARHAPQARIGRGACIESRIGAEPYLPVIAALAQIVRDSDDDAPIELLRRIAPSWLLQLPVALEADDRAALKRQTHGAQQQRMLRELAEALEAIAIERPLTLVFEDLHWSDSATLDFLSMLAQRSDKAKLLVLCSLRPVDAVVAAHPVRELRLGLKSRGLASELALTPLAPDDISTYLLQRLGNSPLPQHLPEKVYEHSRGLPLFMVQIFNHLAQLEGPLDELALQLDEVLPESIQELIALRLEKLSTAAQTALEAASLVGVEFAAAAVAAATGLDVETCENLFAQLSQQQQFVAAHGLAIWPDGTTGGRYRFTHALYAQALLRRSNELQRARLHRLIGERLESAYGDRSSEVASELADHFEAAGIRAKALRYRILTARRALERVAPDEVSREVASGLRLVDSLPPGAQRNQAELSLRVIAAMVMQAEHGYASSNAAEHLDRIPGLLDDGDPSLLESAFTVLWLGRQAAGRVDEALAYADRFQQIGRELNNPALECSGYTWSATSLHLLGRHQESEELAKQAFHIARHLAPGNSGAITTVSGCASLTSQSVTRWFLGFPDQALDRAREAFTCMERMGNPYHFCITRVSSVASVRQWRGDWTALLAITESDIAYCQKYVHRDALAISRSQRGIALAMSGRPDEGLPMLMDSLSERRDVRKIMLSLAMDYVHAVHCLLISERIDQAREALDQAWKALHACAIRASEPEVLRAEGLWLLARGAKNAATQAEQYFSRAYELAQTRGARSLQLRAATSLARLRHKRDPEVAAGLLRGVFDTFSEGHQSADLLEAQSLLDQIRPSDHCAP